MDISEKQIKHIARQIIADATTEFDKSPDAAPLVDVVAAHGLMLALEILSTVQCGIQSAVSGDQAVSQSKLGDMTSLVAVTRIQMASEFQRILRLALVEKVLEMT